MTDEERKAFLERAYEEHLHRHSYDRNMPKLPLKERMEVERRIDEIFDILERNRCSLGYSFGQPKDNPADWANTCLLVNHWRGRFSDCRSINVSTDDSCWLQIQLEPTQAEREEFARRMAQFDLEYEEHHIEQEKKRAEEEAEAKAWLAEQKRKDEERAKANDKWIQDRNKCEQEFVDAIRRVVNRMLVRSNGWFAENRVTPQQIELIRKYADTARDFSDAMNSGLTGMGLYSFNERRSGAHEDMMDAFDLGGDMYASRVTKDIDFIDKYDEIGRKYVHNDEERVVDAIAWALVECQKRRNVARELGTDIGSYLVDDIERVDPGDD